MPCHGLSVHVHGVLMLSVAFNLVRMEGLCTFVRARLLKSAGSPSVLIVPPCLCAKVPFLSDSYGLGVVIHTC